MSKQTQKMRRTDVVKTKKATEGERVFIDELHQTTFQQYMSPAGLLLCLLQEKKKIYI